MATAQQQQQQQPAPHSHFHTQSVTQSPADAALTPLRQWVLNQQSYSAPISLWIQERRTPTRTTIMKFASFTGTEDFYAALLMFAVWIVNGHFGITIGIVLCIGFCVTNVVKDLLRLPRPSLPIVPLERAFDWGFPSHHTLMVTFLSLTMVDSLWKQGLVASASLPYSLGLALVWVACVGFSRLYIGVHSIADLVAGFFSGLGLAALYVNYFAKPFDRYVISDAFRWWHIALFSLGLFLFYPIAKPATTTFLDCMVTLGAFLGCAVSRNRLRPELFPALIALPPSSFANVYTFYLCVLLRLVIGFSMVMGLRQVAKKVVPLVLRPILENVWGPKNVMQNVQRFIETQPSFTHGVPSWQSGSSKNAETEALVHYLPRIKYLHDATLRFIVYLLVTWSAVEVMPQVFALLDI